MRLIFYILFLFFQQGNAQEIPLFHYEHSLEQNFKFQPNKANQYNYVHLEKNRIKTNTIFQAAKTTNQLIIPSSGFYELSGFFNFNLNADNVNLKRCGINFGFVQIYQKKETYIAATRFSYKKESQQIFQKIEIKPTIVYLEKGVMLVPAISAGLLNVAILDAKIGCKTKNCISFEWTIKKISNELFEQIYF